jgi:hypothetical protein
MPSPTRLPVPLVTSTPRIQGFQEVEVQQSTLSLPNLPLDDDVSIDDVFAPFDFDFADQLFDANGDWLFSM